MLGMGTTVAFSSFSKEVLTNVEIKANLRAMENSFLSLETSFKSFESSEEESSERVVDMLIESILIG